MAEHGAGFLFGLILALKAWFGVWLWLIRKGPPKHSSRRIRYLSSVIALLGLGAVLGLSKSLLQQDPISLAYINNLMTGLSLLGLLLALKILKESFKTPVFALNQLWIDVVLIIMNALYSSIWWGEWESGIRDSNVRTLLISFAPDLLVLLVVVLTIYYQYKRAYINVPAIYRISLALFGAECFSNLYFSTQLHWRDFVPFLEEWQVEYPNNGWMQFFSQFAGFRIESDLIHTYGLVAYYSVIIWGWMQYKKKFAQ